MIVKRNSKTKVSMVFATAASAAIVLFLAAGCSSPYGSELSRTAEKVVSDGGSIAISLADEESRSQVETSRVSSVSIDDASIIYSITLHKEEAPEDAAPEKAEDIDGLPPEPVVFENLDAGSWTVHVEGRDAAGNVVLEGRRSGITVEEGSAVQVYIVLVQLEREEEAGQPELDSESESESEPESIPESGPESEVESEPESGPESEVEPESESLPESEPAPAPVPAPVPAPELAPEPAPEPVVEQIPSEETIEPVETPAPLHTTLPSTWQDLFHRGIVAVDTDESGSTVATFTGAAYSFPHGESYAETGEDGSLRFFHRGERRALPEMPDISHGRVSVLDAQVAGTAGGWAVLFHGGYSATGDWGEFNGYSLQIDPGLGDRIVIRQWVDGRHWGRELPQFAQVRAAEVGVDLHAPMNVHLDLAGSSIRVQIEQYGNLNTVFEIDDIVSIANEPENARTGGFIGIRVWSETDLSIESVRIQP